MLRLAPTGIAGGIVGALTVSYLPIAIMKPVVWAYLLIMGIVVVTLAIRGPKPPPEKPTGIKRLGLVGGFLDAAGGGGWGPVVTSNLLIQGADPRKVVGTVSAVEFFLTVTISASFIYHLGVADLAGATLGLLIGGLLAAPLGAWAAKHFPAKQMLILVGVVLTATSAYGVWAAWG